MSSLNNVLMNGVNPLSGLASSPLGLKPKIKETIIFLFFENSKISLNL